MTRTVVASFGKPGLRDLDFGRQVVDWFQQLDWPDEVVIEDLPCSAPLVLHRLQKLRPAKVVLLGAVSRGVDPPGVLRRYRLDAAPVDLDNTLAIARQWGGLPTDTVVIEVEPADSGLGPGFSDALAASFDPILEMVREELSGQGGVPRALDTAVLCPTEPEAAPWEPTEAMSDLVGYARQHARALTKARPAPAVPGMALAGRVRPWGVFVESGGDWFDAVPLGDGWLMSW